MVERIEELGFVPHLSQGVSRTIIGVIGGSGQQFEPGYPEKSTLTLPQLVYHLGFQRFDTGGASVIVAGSAIFVLAASTLPARRLCDSTMPFFAAADATCRAGQRRQWRCASRRFAAASRFPTNLGTTHLVAGAAALAIVNGRATAGAAL